MNRFILLGLAGLFTLALCVRTFSSPSSDEETLKKLEMETAKHAGFGEADVAFQKSVFGPRVISIDPLGHVYDQGPADVEKMNVAIRTANPDAKADMQISDIKVRISGDMATVWYKGTYTATGFRDPNANVPGAGFVAIDTWQKQSGKWKLMANAGVSTGPIPAEAYKAAMPGAN
jgi:hypothetical protein